MMRTLKYTAPLAAAALLAAACANDPADEAPPQQCSNLPICWNVREVATPAVDTRALIGNDRTENDPEGSTDPTDPDYFLPLSEACAVAADDPLRERGFAVGLFGDYSYEENGKRVTVYDLYRGARLVYLPDVDLSSGVLSKWDTNVGDKYWYSGARYIFRAYYPQRLHGYTVSTSNATTLAMVYPSRNLQYDLLLGYAVVEATPQQMGKAVELNLSHALAALRFEFRLNFVDTDWLTSVYLLNDEGRSYVSLGTVTYGTEENPDNVTWFHDYKPFPYDELYRWVPPAEYWGGKTAANPDGKKAAELERELERQLAGKDDAEVERILAENPAIMRTTKDASDKYVYHNARSYTVAREEDQSVEGQLYTRNSGWVLIIPQESHGKLTLCFTTKRGGDTVYKVALPKETGTKITVNDSAGNDVEKDVWQAGMRYTYLVTMMQSDFQIDVSIKPWNERKHSSDIIF